VTRDVAWEPNWHYPPEAPMVGDYVMVIGMTEDNRCITRVGIVAQVYEVPFVGIVGFRLAIGNAEPINVTKWRKAALPEFEAVRRVAVEPVTPEAYT
jgi:uncharacterized protein YhfF